MACMVLKIPHGVSYAQLSRFSREAPKKTVATTLTTPDDLVVSGIKGIYDALSAAATTCDGWMSRLSDSDISRHIDVSEGLGAALASLMGANTRVQFNIDLARVEKLLVRLNEQSDLARFIKNYPSSASGTHFLDVFYSPLLMRVHVINSFLHKPLLSLEDLPILQIWLKKSLEWPLFMQSLGVDFATEMITYYKDRGSHLFNSAFAGSPERNHIKYVPGTLLRQIRFAVCSQAVSRTPQWPFVHNVVKIEADALRRLANVDMRIGALTSALEKGSIGFVSHFERIRDALEDVQPHLLEACSLTQLWQLEIETWVSLSEAEDVLTPLIQGMLEHVNLGIFVDALMEMISIGHDERLLKDLLQLVYRESSPSTWAAVSARVPQVSGSVIVKDNWDMHYKFPAISLVCGMYSLLKARILLLHGRFCPSEQSLEAPITDKDGLLADLRLLKKLADMLEKFLREHYKALVSPVEFARWQEGLRAAEQLLASLEHGWDEDWPARKTRMGWKKLKREWVLGLRTQKKYLVPKMLRFVSGETLETAQLNCLSSLDEADRKLLVEQLTAHATPLEIKGVFYLLRAQRPEMYTTWRALLPSADLLPEPEQAERLRWHPKFAGVPFILGLANRVMLEDLSTMVRAAKRSLRGLGELPYADIRNTFEIFYHHFLSHKAIVFEPINAALAADGAEEYASIEPRVEALEALLIDAEADEHGRRVRLQAVLGAAESLLLSLSVFFQAYEAKFVPICVNAFSYQQSMDLFTSILRTYHASNPHLLARTIASLQEPVEYEFFCRNILSVPYTLLKDVLDSVRAEIPTRIWLRVTGTMPTLSGVTLDSQYWPTLPLYGGLPLFWRLCHRYIESELCALLIVANERPSPSAMRYRSLLQSVQNLVQHLEKHGTFEDVFMLPRIACAVPTIAESSYEDTSNEHSLLESNELRLIAILRASFKALSQSPNVVPVRQVNRLKRQLRSYQTLILPHLIKEEEKYLPVLLYRISPQQMLVLTHHLFVLYGTKLLNDDFIVALMRLASEHDRHLFFVHFVPIYLKYQNRGGSLGGKASGGESFGDEEPVSDRVVFPSSEFFFLEQVTFEEAKLLCERGRPKLWLELKRNFRQLFA